MNLQPLMKLPFRLAREIYRAGRDTILDPAPAPPSRPAAARPSPAPSAPAPAPAPPPEPVAPAVPLSVRVEPTPNPDARKFVCNVRLIEEGSVAANGAAEARGHRFVAALFDIEGVRTVFSTNDFVTITRQPDGPSWSALQPAIEATLRDTVGT